MRMFRGWIFADRNDASLLKSLGVTLGYYDEQFSGFEECIVSERTLAKLREYWGQFVWHFKPIENCPTPNAKVS